MIKQSIFSRMVTLRKVKYLLNVKESLLLFKSKILPYFDLGDLFYDSARADQVRGLQTIQNKCLKIIFGTKSVTNLDDLYVQSRLLKTKDRRILSILKFGHRLSYVSTNLKEHGERSVRSTRKLQLKIPRAHKGKFEKCFVYRACKLWNQLPEVIKKLRLMYNFVTRVKRELLLQKLNFPE